MVETCGTVGDVQALARASWCAAPQNREDDMGYSPHSRIRLRATVGLLLCCFASLVGATAASAETVAFDTGPADRTVLPELLAEQFAVGESFTVTAGGDLARVEVPIAKGFFNDPGYPIAPVTVKLF